MTKHFRLVSKSATGCGVLFDIKLEFQIDGVCVCPVSDVLWQWELDHDILHIRRADHDNISFRRLLGTESFENDYTMLVPEKDPLSLSCSFRFHRGTKNEKNYPPMFLVRSGEQCMSAQLGIITGKPHGRWEYESNDVLHITFHYTGDEKKAHLHVFKRIEGTDCFRMFSGAVARNGIIVPTSSKAMLELGFDNQWFPGQQDTVINPMMPLTMGSGADKQLHTKTFHSFKGTKQHGMKFVALLDLLVDGTVKVNNKSLPHANWVFVQGFLIVNFADHQPHDNAIQIFEPIVETEHFAQCCSFERESVLVSTSESFPSVSDWLMVSSFDLHDDFTFRTPKRFKLLRSQRPELTLEFASNHTWACVELQSAGNWQVVGRFLHLNLNDSDTVVQYKHLWGTESFVGIEADEILIPEDNGSPPSSYLYYRGQQTENNYMPMFLLKSGEKCIVHQFGSWGGAPHGSWICWDWVNDKFLKLDFHYRCEEDKASPHEFQRISNTFCFFGNKKKTMGTMLVPTCSATIEQLRCENLDIHHGDVDETFNWTFYVYRGRDNESTNPITLLKLFSDGKVKCNNNQLEPQIWKRLQGVLIIQFCNGDTHLFEPLLGTQSFVRTCSNKRYFLFATSLNL